MKYPHHAIAHQSLESIEYDECREPNNDTTARRFRTLFNEIERRDDALREAERFMAYFANETDGVFAGPGTPTTCLAQIRAALVSSNQSGISK